MTYPDFDQPAQKRVPRNFGATIGPFRTTDATSHVSEVSPFRLRLRCWDQSAPRDVRLAYPALNLL